MSDILQQHANSNNLTRFTQDWYIQKQIPLENGVPKNGQDYSQQILNDFRMYKNNKDTPKLDTSKAKPVKKLEKEKSNG